MYGHCVFGHVAEIFPAFGLSVCGRVSDGNSQCCRCIGVGIKAVVSNCRRNSGLYFNTAEGGAFGESA